MLARFVARTSGTGHGRLVLDDAKAACAPPVLQAWLVATQEFTQNGRLGLGLSRACGVNIDVDTIGGDGVEASANGGRFSEVPCYA